MQALLLHKQQQFCCCWSCPAVKFGASCNAAHSTAGAAGPHAAAAELHAALLAAVRHPRLLLLNVEAGGGGCRCCQSSSVAVLHAGVTLEMQLLVVHRVAQLLQLVLGQVVGADLTCALQGPQAFWKYCRQTKERQYRNVGLAGTA